MKKYVLIGFFFTAILSGCAEMEQFSGQNLFRAQNAAMKYIRKNILNPSAFTLHVEVFAGLPSSEKEKISVVKCGEMSGEAFVVSEKGYFLTNHHLVSITKDIEKECRAKAAQYITEKNLNFSESDVSIFSKNVLVKADKKMFTALMVKSWWPKTDLALLRVFPETKEVFRPVTFSTSTFFSDEAVAVIGAPLGLRDSIVLGKIVSPYFMSENKGESKFLVFNASTEEGDSGGPLIALSDMTVVGMTTVIIPRNEELAPTQFSGAIPAQVIQDALREVTME